MERSRRGFDVRSAMEMSSRVFLVTSEGRRWVVGMERGGGVLGFVASVMLMAVPYD